MVERGGEGFYSSCASNITFNPARAQMIITGGLLKARVEVVLLTVHLPVHIVESFTPAHRKGLI